MGRYSSREYIKERKEKELRRILAELKRGSLLVEGKKDKKALEEIGCARVFMLNRRVEEVCKSLSRKGIEEIIVLTDMDRTGDRLCREAEELLVAYRIRTDTMMRRRLGGLLNLRRFENVKEKLNEFEIGDFVWEKCI